MVTRRGGGDTPETATWAEFEIFDGANDLDAARRLITKGLDGDAD